MATETIISRAPMRVWQSVDGAAEPWFVAFDSTISEDVTFASKVTEHPVASGSPVHDHMYDLPAKLTISAVVSDVLRWKDLELVQAGLEPIDPYYSTEKSRSTLALERLVILQKSHEPFNVQTGLRLFSNMVVEEIHYVTDMKNAAVLSFTAKLTEVRIASTQTVIYPVRADKKTKKQADAAKDKGHVEASEPELTAKQRQSLFLKALQGGFGVLQ